MSDSENSNPGAPAGEQPPAESSKTDGFFWSVCGFQTVIFLLFAWGTAYGDEVTGRTNVAGEDHELSHYYPMFQDVHIMIFIGFGFLMTFLRRYGFGSVSLNFMLAALAIEITLLLEGFFAQLWESDGSFEFKAFEFNVESMIDADFGAAVVLISFGAVLGKLSSAQLVWMVLFELVFYKFNFYVLVHELKIVDVGGSIAVHAFGAYFGLGLTRVLTPSNIESAGRDKDNKSVYHSDLFAMIGSIFLWCYWPSFNAALAPAVGNQQHRAVLNTYLALSSSVVITFMFSRMLRGGKFEMVDIQNATLAGGVAVGSSANLMLEPAGALFIGMIGGLVSTFGFARISDFMYTRLGFHDTCGVHNLHGLPGVVGGVASAFASAIVSDDRYGGEDGSLYSVFPARAPSDEGRSGARQGTFQFIGLGMTVVGALISGMLTGMFLRSPLFTQPAQLYTDKPEFHTPDLEIPEYHSEGSLRLRGPRELTMREQNQRASQRALLDEEDDYA